MIKTKLKNGDLVKVITGKYRGIVDYISQLELKKQLVYLKKVNKKKYDKSTPETKKKSELKEIMVPIHISNVAYWLEDKKITKIGFQKEVKGRKIRKSRKYNILKN